MAGAKIIPITQTLNKKIDDLEKTIEILQDNEEDIYKRIDKQQDNIAQIKEKFTRIDVLVDKIEKDIQKIEKHIGDFFYKMQTNLEKLNEKNHQNNLDIENWRTTIKTATTAFKIGASIFCFFGSGAISFVLFIGGKILKWW